MLTRREFLSGAAAVAAGFPAIAQSRPLRIGALISQADARGQDEMIQPYDQQMKLGSSWRSAKSMALAAS